MEFRALLLYEDTSDHSPDRYATAILQLPLSTLLARRAAQPRVSRALRFLVRQEGEQGGDTLVFFDRVSKAGAPVDRVAISPPKAGDRHVPFLLQLCDDALHDTFRDPDPHGDITHACVWLGGDTHQDVSMVCQKRPLASIASTATPAVFVGHGLDAHLSPSIPRFEARGLLPAS